MKHLHPLLSVHLSVEYPGKPAVLRQVAFHIEPGEIVGLVGQSGSGKSTLALALLRLLHLRGGSAHGEVFYKDRDLMQLPEREMRKLRGREIAYVSQSPLSALNPALRIGTQLKEVWRAHASGNGPAPLLETLQSVSLPTDETFLQRYPSQISVGQAQRLLIAMAILHRPALLIADEPTSALDVITQAEILELFGRLNRDLSMAILFISHDLLSVASLCHRITILENGEIVECGRSQRVFEEPAHPYTRRLIESLPRNPYTSPYALATSLPGDL
ncbi:MAG: ABC transporter ATP-binding protein [Candidatus Acidiferrales bacterium]